MGRNSFTITDGRCALIAAALHDGHEIRSDVAASIALTANQRLREEDPFTASWTAVSASRIVALRSRFEVDFNRPRSAAVYRRPDDAWGLEVWKPDLPECVVERSLAQYDAFYASVETLLEATRRLGSRNRSGRSGISRLRGRRRLAESGETRLGAGEAGREVRRTSALLVQQHLQALQPAAEQKAADSIGDAVPPTLGGFHREGPNYSCLNRRRPRTACPPAAPERPVPVPT